MRKKKDLVRTQEDTIKKSFGDRMRELRQMAGISQEALADACHLDRTYIGDVERGKINVSLINICKIAAGLNTTPQELVPTASLFYQIALLWEEELRVAREEFQERLRSKRG